VGILARLGLKKAPQADLPSLGGKIVRVGPGDTLRTIARREYGDEMQWERILQANHGKVQDAESLNLGTELVLP
jgi:nucleoid-associated protein YgaU